MIGRSGQVVLLYVEEDEKCVIGNVFVLYCNMVGKIVQILDN